MYWCIKCFAIKIFYENVHILGHSIALKLSRHHLQTMIKKHPEMREQLIPNYRFGCKRVGISNKYYRALDQSHVKLITSKIDQVGDNWIKTVDGEREEIDVSYFLIL